VAKSTLRHCSLQSAPSERRVVIDMIEDDLTLIDDPDILEQLYKK
jgi:hypothetical protein